MSTDNVDTSDSADSLMPASEVIKTIHAVMPGRARLSAGFAPESTRVTFTRPGSDGNSSSAPMGGAVLSDDEMGRLAYTQSQTRSAVDFRNEIGSLEQRLAQLDEKLGLHTFDPVTGEKRYTLFGRDRATLESERASVSESLGVASLGLPLAEAREAEARAAQDRRTAEDAVIAEAAQGDRRKEQMIREEVDRIHARQLAEWVVANRASQAPGR